MTGPPYEPSPEEPSRSSGAESAPEQAEEPGTGVEETPVPFRRLSPLTPIARSGIFLAAVAFFFGREVLEGRGESELGVVGIAAIAAVLGGLAIGFFSWWRTAFRISETELRLDTGLISRQSRRVRLDRIVAIDVNQPFIARLLGLAELRVETATTDSEVSLAFLRLGEARSLREVLLAERRALTETSAEGAEPGSPTPPGLAAEAVPLVRVRTSWHLTSLLASPETVVLALIVLFVVGMIAAGADLAGFGVGLAGVVGTALTLLNRLVGRWNWRVGALPTGVQVSHGLFNVTSQTFHVARLQGLLVKEPVLWRPFGLAQLQLFIAGGAGGEEGQGGGVVLPVAPRDLTWRLAHDLLGAEARTVPLGRPPRRASWLNPFARPFLAWGHDDRLLVVRDGVMCSRMQVVPLARAQSLRVAAGPLQRLLSLASVRMDSADGATSLTARHLPRDVAREFFDGAVERARTARMPQPELPQIGSQIGSPAESPAEAQVGPEADGQQPAGQSSSRLSENDAVPAEQTASTSVSRSPDSNFTDTSYGPRDSTSTRHPE